MKLLKPLSLALILTLPASSFADCRFASGGYQMGTSFDGPTICTGKVDSVVVQGPLTVDQAKIQSASVNGPVTTTNSGIKTLTMNGVLKAQDSEFANITANGDLYFTHSKARNITIQKSALGGSHQIYLDSTSIVGNVNFEGGHGIIYESKGAQIKGKVTGASIENQ